MDWLKLHGKEQLHNYPFYRESRYLFTKQKYEVGIM